jgi:pentatricopeptide repeat protein
MFFNFLFCSSPTVTPLHGARNQPVGYFAIHAQACGGIMCPESSQSYNCLLRAYARADKAEAAVALFDKMFKADLLEGSAVRASLFLPRPLFPRDSGPGTHTTLASIPLHTSPLKALAKHFFLFFKYYKYNNTRTNQNLNKTLSVSVFSPSTTDFPFPWTIFATK